jgi:phage terminase large subunit
MEQKTKVQIPSEYSRIFEKDWRHAVIEGGRYSLKSHTAARACLLRARKEKIRIGCLRQFQKNIGDSSYQLLLDLIEQYGFNEFTFTKDSIINTVTGSNFIFKGLDRNVETTIKSLEGIDLVWVDEAQVITRKSIRILVPTVRKPGSQIIWTLNRLTDLDPVIEYFLPQPPREDVWHLQTDYKIAQKNGWLSREILYEIEQSKANHPEEYAHDYLGKAMNVSDKNIIGVGAVLEAMGRQIKGEGAIEVGVDVARMGGDRTVFVMRKGMKEIKRQSFTKKRTTEVCDLLENFVDMNKECLLKIDDTGVGGGVTDEMMKRGYNVMAINFGARATDPDKYPNLISEAWFYIQANIEEMSISNNKELLTELSNRQWKMDKQGRRGVEGKDDYKRRGFRSPDEADATILCFYTPEIKTVDYSWEVM